MATQPNQRLALLAVTIGSGVVFLDGTVVNLALPAMARGLHAGFSALQWIVDGYLLSLSALILIGGSMGDIYGRKKIYEIGLVGFGLTSLVAGLSPTSTTLIILRIVQGGFGAMMVPGALAIINTNFAPSQRAKAFGQWTAWSSAITAFGPLIGGLLIDHASWRWIFFINVPLTFICFFLSRAGVVESKDEEVRHIDIPGGALAAVTLGGIVYGLIEGPVQHWSGSVWAALVVGAVALVAFLGYERRAKDPMLKLDLFASRNFTGINVVTFCLYGGLGGLLFALSIYLQTSLHYSSFETGISFVPITILLLLISPRTGALTQRYGVRPFLVAGPALAGLGMLLLSLLQPDMSYWTGVFPGITLFALGLALTVAPLTTTVMGSVDRAESGVASGVNNAVSRVSGLIVVALLGLLGAGEVYRFATVLSGVLALLAALVAWAVISNDVVAPVAKEAA